MKIAFIGLGNMGGPMAHNLHKAGHEVRAFDLSQPARDKLAADGVPIAADAKAAVQGAEVVITMLPASQHVEGLFLGNGNLLASIAKGTLVIDSSTIAAATSQKVAKAAEAAGIDFIDAPVSGGTGGAIAGTLTFMVGGKAEALEKARPILAAMGKNIFHAGPAGAGQVAKACNNMLLAIHMIGTCEALELGARNGLDPKVLSEIMLASSGRNWSLEVYNPFPGVMPNAPASNDYKPGFMVDLMVKDLGLAMEIAQQCSVDNVMGQLARELYTQHQQAGNGQRDFSSILRRLQDEL